MHTGQQRPFRPWFPLRKNDTSLEGPNCQLYPFPPGGVGLRSNVCRDRSTFDKDQSPIGYICCNGNMGWQEALSRSDHRLQLRRGFPR